MQDEWLGYRTERDAKVYVLGSWGTIEPPAKESPQEGAGDVKEELLLPDDPIIHSRRWRNQLSSFHCESGISSLLMVNETQYTIYNTPPSHSPSRRPVPSHLTGDY